MPRLKTFVITYPGGDGEQHITAGRTDTGLRIYLDVDFRTVTQKGETDEECLVRIAKDIIRQFDKRK